MSDYINQFMHAITSMGLLAPDNIIDDGKLHRFSTSGKPKDDTGWYVLYGDGIPAGSFGCWRSGVQSSWCAKPDNELTVIERQGIQQRIQAMQALRETERVQLQAKAQEVSAAILARSSPAINHNYLSAKGIQANGAKMDGDRLIIPMRDTGGVLHSLQTITPDGNKRFQYGGKVSGCYFGIGKPDGRLIVCEGFATGASIHECTGVAVAVAFNAGNLESVALALRKKYPALSITIAADDDHKTEGNPGLTKATAAALAVGGMLAVPVFSGDRPDKATDFNDLHQLTGSEAVQRCIESAQLKAAPIGEALPNREKLNRIVQLRCGSLIMPTAIVWLWDGWLPKGKLTILAGTGGTGKTTLALGLAATLTSGGRWPDGMRCNDRGNVLIWSSEDSPDDTLVPRLVAAGADMGRCHFIEGITQDGESMPFDPAQDIGELNKAVERIGGVSLLIIDPIVSAVAGDMHRANDVRRSLQAIVDFAEVHNCAVIGITHFAKGGAGKSPQDRVIGSQAFGALARMVLVAAKEEDGDRRVLARAKSNIAPDTGGVAYGLQLTTIAGGIEATHVVWEGVIEGTAREILGDVEHDESESGSSQGDLQKMLIDLLIEHGGKMPAKVVKAEVSDAGYSWTAANNAKARAGIESAKEPGRKTSGWYWYLPNTAPIKTTKQGQQSEESAELKADSSDSCDSCPVQTVEVEL